MGMLDSLKYLWGGYQDALPDWATKDYSIIPEAQGGEPFQQKIARAVLSVNPSIDLPLSAITAGVGGLAGRLAGKGTRAYQGSMKASRGVRHGSDPMKGFADNAAGTVRGDVPPAPRFADDFRAVDDLAPLDEYPDWQGVEEILRQDYNTPRSVGDNTIRGEFSPRNVYDPYNKPNTELGGMDPYEWAEMMDPWDNYATLPDELAAGPDAALSMHPSYVDNVTAQTKMAIEQTHGANLLDTSKRIMNTANSNDNPQTLLREGFWDAYHRMRSSGVPEGDAYEAAWLEISDLLEGLPPDLLLD